MKRIVLIMALAFTVGLSLSNGARSQTAGKRKAAKRTYETKTITVHAGGRTREFSLEELRKMPKVTLADVEQSGTDKGPQGVHSWSGASLKDVMLEVDPQFCAAAGSGNVLSIVSQDGWSVRIKRTELCGMASGGEALFRVKACNECHGVDGEGAPKDSLRAGPALRDRSLDLPAVLARLRAGRNQHSYINPYTSEQLTESELRQILDWLSGKRASAGSYVVPENRRAILLALERDGQPITGNEGLIQMVVGMDDYVNRFSHWVSEINVE